MIEPNMSAFAAATAVVPGKAKKRQRLAYASVVITIGALIALSTVVKVSGAVIAAGNLSVTSQTKSVSHQTGGILADIRVHEGQMVRTGEVLMQLDTDVTQASVAASTESVSALSARRERLEAELAGRTAVGLPPAVHMAVVDGASDAVAAFVAQAVLPDHADLLGPVDLPPGVRRPPATPADEPAIRMLVRVPRDEGLILAGALRAATAVHSARHDHEAVRVQIDPLHVG
jgi:hypothetical protein